MKRQPRPEAVAGDAARLGEELRDARLALGLTVDDLAASLRIRRVYLVALEEGRVRDLPAPAYALGFGRSYSAALGLDADEFVRRFRDSGGPAAPRKTDLVFPEPVPERGVPAGAVILVGAVLALGAYVGWYQWSGGGGRTVDAVPPLPARLEPATREGSPPETPPPVAVLPAPPVAGAVAGAPRPGASPAAVPPAATIADAPAPPRPEEPGRIVLRAKAETWVQVRDRPGGPILVNRVLRPGETWAAPAGDGLLLSTGNALGLEILVDGQPAPGLTGNQAVRRDVPLDPDRLKVGVAPPVPVPPVPVPPVASPAARPAPQ